MANTIGTGVGQQQLYNDQVLKGFVATLAPLRAFSLDVSPAPAEKGYTVNMSFVPSGSAPASWSEATGYAIQSATRIARAVSLDNHYFVSNALTDTEMANSSIVRLSDTAFNQGASLGTYVFQNIIGAISASTFTNGYNVATASALSVANLLAVRKVAVGLNWGENKNVIVNPTGFYGLLGDSKTLYLNRGTDDVVRNGVMTGVYGFNNVWETSGYPTDIQSGSNFNIGIACAPEALLVAMRYLVPGDEGGQQLIEAYPLTDPTSGITVGYRKWYDPDLGKVKSVYECVWGKVQGNANAAVHITATDRTS